MWVLVAFLAWPLVEIGLFVEIGGRLGLWPTLALVLLSGALGLGLLRREGMRAQSGLRATLSGLGPSGPPPGESALIFLAGILLILPGFLTDTFGLVLLVAPLRRAILRKVTPQGGVSGFGFRRPYTDQAQAIEGEFIEVIPENTPQEPPSGRTRH